MGISGLKTRVFLGLICSAMLLLVGCAANGYITAAVQSVMGLDISENPQTQVPHVRFGFVRSQYYYIPTGKVSVGGGPTGSAGETPELVSDINIELEFLTSARIKEKFAVGKTAVATPSAQYLFLPAVEAGKYSPPMVAAPELSATVRVIRQIIRKDPHKREAARKWVVQQYPGLGASSDPVEIFLDHPPSPAAVEELLKQIS